jgi:NAD-dependent dihydropyrimidine dehydrogenase PreA subunit
MEEMRYLEGVTTLQLEEETCIGCGMCGIVCPHAVFIVEGKKARIVERDRCMECGACARNCPVTAIKVQAGVGCAGAIIYGWLTGKAPSCDCSGDSGNGSCC